MLHYILQTVAFQVFFLIIYDVFLKKETFFNWNRAYLMLTALLSFALPFLKFESIKAIVPEPMVIRLPEVIIGEVSPTLESSSVLMQPAQLSEQAMTFSWTYVWVFGMLLMLFILAYKMIKILKLLHANPKRWKGDVLIVYLLNSTAAFSFFHYIFLGSNIQTDKKEHIVQHEMVHIKEKHSLDLLIFELIRILFWFNPLVYMYQNRVTTLHEFIADAKAVKYKGKSEYYQSLLSQVFETQQISFVNPFFKQSLIKKRILMLSKSKSKQIHLLKYALLIPMVMAMLMYTSSYASEIKDSFPFLQEKSVNQELTFQELVEKYYDEILELRKSKKDFFGDVYPDFMSSEDKYIDSKDEVAKKQAFMKFLVTGMIEKREKEGELTEEDREKYNKMANRYETYEDYRAYKQTAEAKESWENRARNGELRLFVEDMGNLTEAEEKRKAEKMALIDKDDFYHTLHMTDGRTTAMLEFDKKKAKTQNTDSDQVTIESVEEDIEVPFAVIEQVPIFPGCEGLSSNNESKICMSNKISEFVNKNFNVDLATKLGLKGKQRISVIFKIGKDGKIRDVRSRAPHPALEAEAVRVIEALPDVIPGKQKGKVVTVPYSLPILFQVNDDVPEAKEQRANAVEQDVVEVHKNEIQEDIEVPYAVIDEVPLFPSCETMGTREERKQCTSDKISSFVNKNFNTKLGKQLGLGGTQRISVIFKIDKDGTIFNIRARASHPDLEKEAIRVIEALPTMLPGKQKGKTVVVPFSLPIVFQVQ